MFVVLFPVIPLFWVEIACILFSTTLLSLRERPVCAHSLNLAIGKTANLPNVVQDLAICYRSRFNYRKLSYVR